MNNQELIDAIASKTGESKKTTAEFLDAYYECVSSALAKGEEVRRIGFGTFKVTHSKARDGRNPRTGETIKIPASKRPSFSAGKDLKETVNS